VTIPTIDILYEDNHVLGVYKPAGLLVQGDRTGDPTALELARNYIKEEHRKPGNVFLGLVHRLDRPVSGVVVFARTSKAASRLARSFHDRVVEKRYLAVVGGRMPEVEGVVEGHVKRDHKRSRLALPGTEGARPSSLRYRVLDTRPGFSLLEVTPHTGRHHQIRLMLAAEGAAIVGDVKYGAPEALPDRTIALHAATLRFPHPTRDETVVLSAPPVLEAQPWQRFRATIEAGFATGG
jgi:23S rRNA pseudouridine1911/1915/1917 synthase